MIPGTEVSYPEALLLGLAGYEQFAIVTGLVPTLSAVCREHRWVEAALVTALALHLHRWARMEDEVKRRVPWRDREGERHG